MEDEKRLPQLPLSPLHFPSSELQAEFLQQPDGVINTGTVTSRQPIEEFLDWRAALWANVAFNGPVGHIASGLIIL